MKSKFKKCLALVFLLGLFSLFTSSIAGSLQYSPFNVFASSIVFTDTSSAIYFPGQVEDVVGWKGSSIIKGYDPNRFVDYRNATVNDELSYLRLKKEFFFSAKDYLNSFNLAGILVFDKSWGGDVDDITVGRCAEVLAIKGSKFYTIDMEGRTQINRQDFPWIEKGDAPASFSCGIDGALFGIGGSYGGLTPGYIYQWMEIGSNWTVLSFPSQITSFVRVSAGDMNNVWALGYDSATTTTYVYRWLSSENKWVLKNTGLAPDKDISVGSDGVFEPIVLGVKSDPAGDKLVIWNDNVSLWEEVSLGLSGHQIVQISVGNRFNIGAIIWTAGSVSPDYYRIENLNKSSPFSATPVLTRKEVSKVVAGFYGDVWILDYYENYWYRLVGAIIRSALNYLSYMPAINYNPGSIIVVDGIKQEEGFSSWGGIFIGNSDSVLERTGEISTAGIRSPIDLQGGTLKLNSDLVFSSMTSLLTGGKIDGQGYAIFLTSQFLFPVNESLRITSTMVIDGQNNAIIFSPHSKLIIDPSVTLSLRNIEIVNLSDINDSGFIMMAPDSELFLQDVVLNMSGDYTFTQGRITILDDAKIKGFYKFIFESENFLTIKRNSQLFIDSGATFSYVPRGGQRNLVQFEDETSYLYLNNSCFAAPASGNLNGVLLTKGTFIFDNRVRLENFADGSANLDINKAITLGDGLSSANNVDVVVLSGATLELLGYLDYNPY